MLHSVYLHSLIQWSRLHGIYPGRLQLPMYYEVWLAVVNTFPQQLPFPQQYQGRQGGDREAPTTVGPISFIFIQFSEKLLAK